MKCWVFPGALRHQKNLLKDKLVATVLTGCAPEALATVNQALATEMTIIEDMDLIGQLTISGSIVCAFWGKGDECEMSAFKSDRIDSGTSANDYKYPRVEDQIKKYGKKQCELAV